MNQPGRRQFIFRVTLGYLLLAAAWILLSDRLLSSFLNLSDIAWLSTVKGLFFVLVTTLLLFYALRNVPAEGTEGEHPPVYPTRRTTRLPRLWLYLFALASTLGMLLLRDAMAVSFSQQPLMILFMFPIILSAIFGGLGPGLTATLVAALVLNYYAIPPRHSFLITEPYALYQWSFLIADGILVSALSEYLHYQRRQTEATRQEQAVTLESIDEGVITTDRDGRITFLNAEAERLTGWSGDEARGRALAEVYRIIAEDDRLPLPDPIQRHAAGGAKPEAESRALLLARDGRELPIQDSGAQIRYNSTSLLGGILVFRDDSQRRQAEKSAVGENAFSHDLIASLPAALYRLRVQCVDATDTVVAPTSPKIRYKFEMFSDSLCTLLGLDRQALEKNPNLVYDCVHPEDQADFARANEEALAGFFTFTWEGRILDGDRVRWLHFESVPRRLEHGESLWTGIVTDITARKRSEEQLTMLATFLEKSSKPFAQGFPDGRLGLHNQAFLDLLGYTAEELATLDWAKNLTPPEWLEKERPFLAELQETGKPIRFEKELIRKDGSRVPVELLVHLARDREGNPQYYYSFFSDLTKRKQAELDLRHSEETYRTLFDHMLNGLAYCRMLFDGDRPVDFVYLTVNASFEKLTGLQNVQGRKVSEVIPGIREADPELFARYGRVARGGPPERFEIYVAALKMWFWISVYSAKPEHFVAVFYVIT